MPRYIRLYDSPSAERPGSVLGFSGSISELADEPVVHEWFRGLGYTATAESKEQKEITRSNPRVKPIRPEILHEAPHIPIPEETVSISHLLIEPPVIDAHLPELANYLMNLVNNDAVIGNPKMTIFCDNRGIPAAASQTGSGTVIASWE